MSGSPVGPQRAQRVKDPAEAGLTREGRQPLSGLQLAVGDLIAQFRRIIIVESRRMMCI